MSKLRRGMKKDGTPGKANLRLAGRVKAWEDTVRNARGDSKAYRKPGALK